MTRAVFRVDASPTIGAGHLARSSLLARHLAQLGFEVAIATRAPTEHTRAVVARAGCCLVEISGPERAATLRAVEGAALAVVDGYTFTSALHHAMRSKERIVCVIDDLADASIHADVVHNGNFFAMDLAPAYAAKGLGRALLGPSFALVREEFREARPAREAREGAARELRPRLLVTMGGADPARATERFLEALPLVEAAHVTVVVGGANPRVDLIRREAARFAASRHAVEVIVDAHRMSELMVDCDVAIAAAGGTCLELATVGVPAVVVAVADNQVPVAGAVARLGLMDSVGRIETADARALAEAVNGLLRDEARRRAATAAQRACVDGKGAERTAAVLARMVAERAPVRG